jgi:hypothetical protein
VDEGRERERSRVRAPSPPSRYDNDDDDNDSYDEYDDPRKRSARPAVVTAEPRGYGGGVDQYRTSSPPGRGADPYAVPGAFETSRREEVKVSYGDGRGKEKDYYAEAGYSVRKEGHGRGEPERSRYSEQEASHTYADSRDREKEYREKEYRKKEQEEREYRERSASFNISAGHSSLSGGAGFSHGHGSDPHSQQYAPPPGPNGYQAPPAPHSQQYAPPPGPTGYQPPTSYGPSQTGYQGVHPSPHPNYPLPPAGFPPTGYPPSSAPEARHPSLPPYAELKQWEYAKPPETITYSKRTESYTRPASPPRAEYTSSSSKSRHGSKSYASEPARSSVSSLTASNVVTVEPGSRSRRERDKSPAPGLGGRMHSLSVSTGHHGSASMSLANAPGSPLLESYHGTYQSISPMPSPLMIASSAHNDLAIIESISPISSDDEGRRGKPRRNARFHDPADEASILAKALKGEKHAPDTDPLVEILPGLTHEQVLELRVEYKKIVKTGSEKKGVNIAKHIKLRLKEEDPSLMKACYACALGRWESEAYWANFWYQGEKSRRELLIESLMGRTNREIRAIKDGFSDKKYSDSLTKCMKMELKEDKFKKAVLLVLEEKKMEERSGHLDSHLVDADVKDLYKAVRSEKGGESAMIGIVVVRSEAHLREVLRVYEATYRSNFAREMLKKSGNLVVSFLYQLDFPSSRLTVLTWCYRGSF